jgi:NAD(P)H-dependent flavin oxidoreductase YrpB (nitropropane dioxygenase family)
MAAAMALGAQGVWTGSMWLLSTEADMAPEVTENLLEATSRDAIRARVMTGKPARQLRTKWTEAWDRPDAPAPLPMPLQGLLYGEAAERFTRVHSKEFGGHPAGQIIGSLDRVRPAKDMVADMVEQWIEATTRLQDLMAQA